MRTNQRSERLKLSFCTVCKGRRHHLEEVYEKNIHAALSYGNVEFMLLDYQSPDELSGWVGSKFRQWLDAGILRCIRVTEAETFRVAHAKNAVHRLATGHVLINLDADNSFGDGFVEEVASLFADGARVIAEFPGYHRGCSGRIAIRKEDFHALGGYDEDLDGWGYEDEDLLNRARKFGLELRNLSVEHAKAIQHEDKERVLFYTEKDKGKSDERNRLLSRRNVQTGKIIANQGRDWGSAQFEALP